MWLGVAVWHHALLVVASCLGGSWRTARDEVTNVSSNLIDVHRSEDAYPSLFPPLHSRSLMSLVVLVARSVWLMLFSVYRLSGA